MHLRTIYKRTYFKEVFFNQRNLKVFPKCKIGFKKLKIKINIKISIKLMLAPYKTTCIFEQKN